MERRENHLLIGQVAVSELAKKYGTPLYVYDEEKIIRNYKKLHKAFSSRYKNFRVYYAVKANSHPAILKIMRRLGAGADCAAPFEIWAAQKAGFQEKKIIFSGNFSSDDDLAFAFKKGILINLDDDSILPRLLKLGIPQRLSFRINPGFGKSAVSDFLVTAGRMVTIVPTVVVRASVFLVEGTVDGLIEGLFDRKGFLHGESRYL